MTIKTTKPFLCLFSLILLCSSTISYASKPSLDETINYLTHAVEGYAKYSTAYNDKKSFTINLTKTGMATITHIYDEHDDERLFITEKKTFDIRNIGKIVFDKKPKSEFYSDLLEMWLYCRPDAPCATENSVINERKKRKVERKSYRKSYALISSRGRDRVHHFQRIANALVHYASFFNTTIKLEIKDPESTGSAFD